MSVPISMCAKRALFLSLRGNASIIILQGLYVHYHATNLGKFVRVVNSRKETWKPDKNWLSSSRGRKRELWRKWRKWINGVESRPGEKETLLNKVEKDIRRSSVVGGASPDDDDSANKLVGFQQLPRWRRVWMLSFSIILIGPILSFAIGSIAFHFVNDSQTTYRRRKSRQSKRAELLNEIVAKCTSVPIWSFRHVRSFSPELLLMQQNLSIDPSNCEETKTIMHSLFIKNVQINESMSIFSLCTCTYSAPSMT